MNLPAASRAAELSVPATAPLAAIDMGSNSFRLEIAHLPRGQYKRLEYLKETVRLGAGLDGEGMLTEAAMQRGLDCLRRFASRLEGFPAARVRAVATQTLREARNRNAFLARAKEALGYPIEVISGREEARLIFAGVARLQPSTLPRLVIDIGGRSTEMILGRGRKPITAESFQVGSVSLSLRFFPDGQFTAEAFRAAQVAAGAELEEAFALFKPSMWQEALGSSGTVGAVAQILAASGQTDGRITPEALRWCIERALEAGSMEQLNLPGLKEDRRAVVGGGLCILYTLLTQFGIRELLPAKGALRQGVIFDLVERLETERAGDGATVLDMREASVAALQKRFGVDLAQAARVQELALRLYKQLAPRASRALQRELAWAAALHEIGMMVSHHDHHRHSAYLLSHVDAAGFSQDQLRRLADLALGQRGGLRKLEAQMSDESLLWQLLSLRLAVIACHARGVTEPKALTLRRNGRQIVLNLPKALPDTQPRALYLLQEEAQAWARSEVLELQLST
ncbi:Ppx/GppA phosphatase family protein [Paucibacter sp. DJ2R-2]|uniref:Ppx/GppA phosphatase family protein n=1 Tax=Paucibacter sp. DJ2R-2 TaxID=2893558 RepID=UPI0021E38B9B|nr:Ppx/GppA phosphatase family protein [Paucibacter sp. DJ2R-2]MCV2421452.1 Ppx/GppA family phosphatase [Paucibacter sp. DJ4R-1]MCV2438134.1 Ppx/GppA family phosphatase [Paucibacter sp. DJ2R-2]